MISETPQARKLKTFYWDYYGKKTAEEAKEWIDITFSNEYTSVTKYISPELTEAVNGRVGLNAELDQARKSHFSTQRIFIKDMKSIQENMPDRIIEWDYDLSFPNK